jgi:Pyruvate/2-oxoacid:ferredoxin oxidoreductase gamma subunit
MVILAKKQLKLAEKNVKVAEKAVRVAKQLEELEAVEPSAPAKGDPPRR